MIDGNDGNRLAVLPGLRADAAGLMIFGWPQDVG
jgi:hypothetical protein